MSLVGGSVRLAGDSRPLEVIILDAAGNPITDFGGGGGGGGGTTATITTIVPTNTSQVLLAANPARTRFLINNETQRSVKVAYAATASATVYTFVIPARSSVELTGYKGVISGIWDNNPNGTVTVTEIV